MMALMATHAPVPEDGQERSVTLVSCIREFKILVLAENANANVSFYVMTSSVCVEILLLVAEIRAFMDVFLDRYLL